MTLSWDQVIERFLIPGGVSLLISGTVAYLSHSLSRKRSDSEFSRSHIISTLGAVGENSSHISLLAIQLLTKRASKSCTAAEITLKFKLLGQQLNGLKGCHEDLDIDPLMDALLELKQAATDHLHRSNKKAFPETAAEVRAVSEREAIFSKLVNDSKKALMPRTRK